MAQGHMGAIRRIPCSPGRRHRGDLCIREKTEKMKKSIFLVLVAVAIPALADEAALPRWRGVRGPTARLPGYARPPGGGPQPQADPPPRPVKPPAAQPSDVQP